MRQTKASRARRLACMGLLGLLGHGYTSSRTCSRTWMRVWSVARRMVFALLLLCALLTPACITSASAARFAALAPSRAPLSLIDARPLTLADLANAQIAHMSLDDELGQLFIPTFLCCGYTRATAEMVAQLHVGGAILYAANTASAARTRALIAAAQANSPIPLLVTLDEEGGGVDRLRAI